MTDALDVLRELVACKDLKNRIESLDVNTVGLGAMESEYERRKPLAWERARALLAAQEPRPERTEIERLRILAGMVTRWDWSDNDAECVRDVDKLREYLDAAPSPAQQTMAAHECICPRCGIRHGGGNADDTEF